VHEGVRFGKYTLLRKIATGGMAEVYLAVQEGIAGFEKPVAIKEILPYLANDPKFVKMFTDEARIAARLSHPNIVQIFDLGVEGGIHYLAMEYVFGESLARVRERVQAARKRIPVDLALYVVQSLCLALHHAHGFSAGAAAQPVIHRDVSPHNILVSFDGAVKLADFGVAKVKEAKSGTTQGVIKGKVSYMSPEQIRGEHVDARSDLFALGIVLYELVTGALPFPGNNIREVFDSVTSSEPKRPSALVPCFPDLERVVLKSLEKDPDSRYATAAEMLGDLESVMRTHGLLANPLSFGRFVDTTLGGAGAPVDPSSQSVVSRILAYLDKREGETSEKPNPAPDTQPDPALASTFVRKVEPE
jgi:eukaryotic-like serine/threonine-protein kinase